MEIMTTACVKLNAQASNKNEAIRLAGQLLVNAGYIVPTYVDSMLKREEDSNTFLGAGVAIPHGMAQDRHHILHTGVAVVQFREGVIWKSGDRAHLVVAIAAMSEEHIVLLRRLTRLMQNAQSIENLVTTDDAQRVVSILTDTPMPQITPITEALAWPCDVQSDWTLDYPNGLHARPAARWVDTAKHFASDIRVYKAHEFSDAKALTSLLTLGLTCGESLRIAARGPDAQRAVDACWRSSTLCLPKKRPMSNAPIATLWPRAAARLTGSRSANPKPFTVSVQARAWPSGRWSGMSATNLMCPIAPVMWLPMAKRWKRRWWPSAANWTYLNGRPANDWARPRRLSLPPSANSLQTPTCSARP